MLTHQFLLSHSEMLTSCSQMVWSPRKLEEKLREEQTKVSESHLVMAVNEWLGQWLGLTHLGIHHKDICLSFVGCVNLFPVSPFCGDLPLEHFRIAQRSQASRHTP